MARKKKADCLKSRGLREWREFTDKRGVQWKDPVTGEWSSEHPDAKK